MVTFGGLDPKGQWYYPPDKYKLCRYREMCAVYKRLFIVEIQKAIRQNKIEYHGEIKSLIATVEQVRWVVHTTRPTVETKSIKDYLGRYINRIAISNNRLKYIEQTSEVIIQYNDYKNQQRDQPAPKQYRHLDPLVAIDQILQHVLPRHFQKTRHYGLHHPSNKLKHKAEASVINNGKTVRTVIEIITHLLGIQRMVCTECNCEDLDREELKPDKTYIECIIAKDGRSPPEKKRYTEKIHITNLPRNGNAMSIW
jgi:hypothetical protein